MSDTTKATGTAEITEQKRAFEMIRTQALWISPPSDTIKDFMGELGLTVESASLLCDLSQGVLGRLLEDRIMITGETAKRLSLLGETEQFWLERERQYAASLRADSPSNTNYDLAIMHIVAGVHDASTVRLTKPAKSGQIGSKVMVEFENPEDLEDYINQLRGIQRVAWPDYVPEKGDEV